MVQEDLPRPSGLDAAMLRGFAGASLSHEMHYWILIFHKFCPESGKILAEAAAGQP